MADQHAGAMVALVPTAEDAARLAVDGGESPDELHLTLLYLGKGVDIPDHARRLIVDRLRSLVEDAVRPGYDLPVHADGFAIAAFNPLGDEPCIVLGAGGGDLEAIHGMVEDAVEEVERTPAGFTLPDQHEPWIPHVTLIYSGDTGLVERLTGRTGPVAFDRLRVAFAGDVTDIPLAASVAERYDPHQQRDADGRWSDGVPGPNLPGTPDLDMDGFDLTGAAEGTFGEVRLGVDDAGDVRFAFHDSRGEARALDLDSTALARMRDVIDDMVVLRDELIEDPEGVDPAEVYDWAYFGDGDAHKVELYGSGVIAVLFGDGDATDDDPPWQLHLDPPHDADPDDPEDEDSDDVQAVLDAIDDTLDELDETGAERAAMRVVGVVERKYNPNQLRVPSGEHGGQWTKNPAGSLRDRLRLAHRIDLDPTERLASSSKFGNNGDRDLVFAVTHGPDSNVRIGLVNPEDTGRWKAADKGGTAVLDADELRKLRTDLSEAGTKAKAAAKAADKAWNSGEAPTDPILLGDRPVAEGRLSTIYADLAWDVYLTDDDPASWNLEIRAVSDRLGESEAIRLNPKETRALAKHLDDIQAQVEAGGTSESNDRLGLAGRIDLDPQERLTASSRISDGRGIDVNFAVVHSPDENDVRIGVVPEDDSDNWRALNNGDTATLTADELRQLRTELEDADLAVREAADSANEAWESGPAPTDPKLLGTEPVASGTVPTIYADLHWSAYVTDDGDDGDSAGWQLALTIGDGDSATFNRNDTTALLKHLEEIQMQLGDSQAARAYSQEQGPAYQAPAAQPKGGQFAKGGGRVAAKGRTSKQRKPASSRTTKPSPPDPNLTFNGKTGTGYGVKGGDPRVRTLQQALNRLGLTDSSGNELAVDGRYGPRTTSAVKKLQKALGLPVDGKVTPELLKQASELKQLPPRPPRKSTAKPKPAAERRPVYSNQYRQEAPARRSKILASVSRALGEHRFVDGRCVTCNPDDAAEDSRAVRTPC